MRTGVWLFPAAEAPRLVDAVVAAERCGLDEVWIADEGVAREPMAVLAAAAAQTERVRLAVGITSPLLRHPGALAATAMTIDELSGGRFTLGLGVGGDLSLGPFGLSTDRPVALLADAIDTARAVMTASASYDYAPPAHAIDARHVPIWIGARGPQLTRLAARRADGVFLSGCTNAEHQRIIGDVRAVEPAVALALYQSAGDRHDRASVESWAGVAERLDGDAERFRPDSVGINLVDTIERSADPVAAVERAATVLSELRV